MFNFQEGLESLYSKTNTCLFVYVCSSSLATYSHLISYVVLSNRTANGVSRRMATSHEGHHIVINLSKDHDTLDDVLGVMIINEKVGHEIICDVEFQHSVKTYSSKWSLLAIEQQVEQSFKEGHYDKVINILKRLPDS